LTVSGYSRIADYNFKTNIATIVEFDEVEMNEPSVAVIGESAVNEGFILDQHLMRIFAVFLENDYIEDVNGLAWKQAASFVSDIATGRRALEEVLSIIENDSDRYTWAGNYFGNATKDMPCINYRQQFYYAYNLFKYGPVFRFTATGPNISLFEAFRAGDYDIRLGLLQPYHGFLPVQRLIGFDPFVTFLPFDGKLIEFSKGELSKDHDFPVEYLANLVMQPRRPSDGVL
jgi:hypothetical protein